MSISTTSKTFYTLDESRAFETDPGIKIVYFTEKGIDLCAAIPVIGQIDRAMRNGYSWCHLIDNPLNNSAPSQQIRIVRTTEAELATHIAARAAPPPPRVDHKAAMIAEIDALPTSEWTQERIADIVTDYMIKHGISDFVAADQVCEIVGSRGILKAPEPVIAPSSVLEAVELDTTLDVTHQQHITDQHPDQSVSSIGSISAWLVSSIDSVITSVQQLTLNILPIQFIHPSNTDWILLD